MDRDRMSNQLSQAPESKHLLAVSIHDVSPHTWQDTAAILQRLDDIGIANRILLVIPNFRGEYPIDEANPQFIDWLKSCQEKDEICLHGHQHQATEISGGPIARLMATIYTNREGEFYQIDRSEIENKLDDGMQKFKLLGLDSNGFIAPAWLLSPQAVSVLQEQGFEYTTRLGSIDLLNGKSVSRLKSPTICYSVRSAWRRVISRLWNPLLVSRNRNTPILRAAIHPVDIHYPEIFDQFLKLIAQAAKSREVVTYREIARRYTSLNEQKQEG